MENFLDHLRNGFQGNAEALIAQAQEAAKALHLEQGSGEGNERLLRHYVSMGVVDKPLREGREAVYGFRHLVQFIAARKLLDLGYPLAKIAQCTAAVPTDSLTTYLEQPSRANEVELFMTALRAEAPVHGAAHNASSARPLASMATGMGMVDVMHEMREMEQRVNEQLKMLQTQVHEGIDQALRGMGAQARGIEPEALQHTIGQLADLINQTALRFDQMLQKPLQVIEKQIDQQRFLFEEAYRQKEFLDQMFGNLLSKQRQELQLMLEDQARILRDSIQMQKRNHQEVMVMVNTLETAWKEDLAQLEKKMQEQSDKTEISEKEKSHKRPSVGSQFEDSIEEEDIILISEKVLISEKARIIRHFNLSTYEWSDDEEKDMFIKIVKAIKEIDDPITPWGKYISSKLKNGNAPKARALPLLQEEDDDEMPVPRVPLIVLEEEEILTPPKRRITFDFDDDKEDEIAEEISNLSEIDKIQEAIDHARSEAIDVIEVLEQMGFWTTASDFNDLISTALDELEGYIENSDCDDEEEYSEYLSDEQHSDIRNWSQGFDCIIDDIEMTIDFWTSEFAVDNDNAMDFIGEFISQMTRPMVKACRDLYDVVIGAV
jgi:DNA-binding transcriptional MerR regulator